MRVFASACLVIAACGPTVAVGEDDHGGGGSEEGTSQGSSEGAESGATSEGDDDSTSTGSAETSSSSTGDEVPGMCGRSASEPLGVAVGSDVVQLVLADGSSAPLELDGLRAPVGAWVQHGAAIRGTQIAVVRSWTMGIDARGSAIGVFDGHGALQWQLTQDGAALDGPAIGDDGSIVATRSTDGPVHGVLFDGMADPLVLPDFVPVRGRWANGWIPGRRTTARAEIPGWFDTADASFRPVSSTAIGWWRSFTADAIVYLVEGGIAIEDASGVDVIALDDLGVFDVLSSAGDWLLLRTDDGAGWARVSLDGVVEALDLTPPDGLDPLTCFFVGPQIDRDGGVLVGMRDANVAQVRRLDRGSWTPIGEPVTLVADIGAFPWGGTYVVESMGVEDSFCVPDPWNEPPGDVLRGSLQQIVRPATGFSRVLPEGALVRGADREGTCIAYAHLETTTILDVTTEETIELDFAAFVAFDETR